MQRARTPTPASSSARPGDSRRRLDAARRRQLGADHRARDVGARRASLPNVATVCPARSTVTASATARTSSSLCVTSTIVVPSSASPRSVASKPVDLDRREHRGRLVEDQHLRAGVQRRDDLRALRGAERQRIAARPRIDRQADALAELGERACGRRRARATARRSAPSTAFSTTLSVPANAPCCCTMPMPAARAAAAIPARELDRRARRPPACPVGGTTPATILTSVLLPAPFSPTSACTLPGADREPSRRAARAPRRTTCRALHDMIIAYGTSILPAMISIGEGLRALDHVERQQPAVALVGDERRRASRRARARACRRWKRCPHDVA